MKLIDRIILNLSLLVFIAYTAILTDACNPSANLLPWLMILSGSVVWLMTAMNIIWDIRKRIRLKKYFREHPKDGIIDMEQYADLERRFL